jgi:hypothetical protein
MDIIRNSIGFIGFMLLIDNSDLMKIYFLRFNGVMDTTMKKTSMVQGSKGQFRKSACHSCGNMRKANG